jgi:hypothetical protein
MIFTSAPTAKTVAIFTLPSRDKTATLHDIDCPLYSRRVTVRDAVDYALPATECLLLEWDRYGYGLVFGEWRTRRVCSCVTDLLIAKVRAQAWLLTLAYDRDMLARNRAEAVRWAARVAAEQEFLSQFEPLRATVQNLWGARVGLRKSYRGDGAFLDHKMVEITLCSRESGWEHHESMSVHCIINETGLTIELLNHSTGLVSSAADAMALAMALTAIESWVSPVALASTITIPA